MKKNVILYIAMQFEILKMEAAAVRELYEEAFPRAERRDFDGLHKIAETHPCFFLRGIFCDGKMVGILGQWTLDIPEKFCFIENFAIAPSYRGSGLGAAVLEHLFSELDCPLLLECEPPDTDLARRRIAFYERNGFRVWTRDYSQPSYGVGLPSLPMWLLIRGDTETLKVPAAVTSILKTVYFR